LSNEQITQELDLAKDDAHQMTSQLRSGVVDLKPEPRLEGTVECSVKRAIIAPLSLVPLRQ